MTVKQKCNKPDTLTKEIEWKTQSSILWNHEKINICCLSHSLYDILLWQPKQTNVGARSKNSLFKNWCWENWISAHKE